MDEHTVESGKLDEILSYVNLKNKVVKLDQEIYSDRYEVILNELPYITHYKNEKYYVFRLESPHKVGKVINLVS